MSSNLEISAASPLRRNDCFMILVYPPGRFSYLGAISVKSLFINDLSVRTAPTCDQLCKVLFFALVMTFSAIRLTSFARAEVVVMDSSLKRSVTIDLSIKFL